MSKIVSAIISPHPPIILPSVGSKEDRTMVKKTIENLEALGEKLKQNSPDVILIFSPHSDWGFDVPLYFLAPDFKGRIEKVLIGIEPPSFYFQEGKSLYESKIKNQGLKAALIASGDLSHCLKEEGPYGFHPQGPKFDKALIDYLEKKDIDNFLKLNEHFPEASECGLRSFSFLLGILEASGQAWEAEILSYEGPFGVGYLVANFKL
jgi:aromatic ring-opening dioxygenase LigB subunit